MYLRHVSLASQDFWLQIDRHRVGSCGGMVVAMWRRMSAEEIRHGLSAHSIMNIVQMYDRGQGK